MSDREYFDRFEKAGKFNDQQIYVGYVIHLEDAKSSMKCLFIEDPENPESVRTEKHVISGRTWDGGYNAFCSKTDIWPTAIEAINAHARFFRQFETDGEFQGRAIYVGYMHPLEGRSDPIRMRFLEHPDCTRDVMAENDILAAPMGLFQRPTTRSAMFPSPLESLKDHLGELSRRLDWHAKQVEEVGCQHRAYHVEEVDRLQRLSGIVEAKIHFLEANPVGSSVSRIIMSQNEWESLKKLPTL